MAAWNCGWCGKHASMTPTGEGHVVSRTAPAERNTGRKAGADLYCTMQCTNCRAHSIAGKKVQIDNHKSTERRPGMASYWQYVDPDEAHPTWIEGQDFSYAPTHIAKAAREAYKCHSIGAYMSAILMTRTSIEAAAKDYEVKSGSLKTKIDKLADDGWIRKAIKEAAHQVRMFGNDMAHGDIKVEVAEEDSLQVLQLLTFILQDLYEVEDLMGKIGVSLEERKNVRNELTL